MRKNVTPRETKFYRKKTKTWKRHKEFVLINKKSFTFLTRKLKRKKYVMTLFVEEIAFLSYLRTS